MPLDYFKYTPSETVTFYPLGNTDNAIQVTAVVYRQTTTVEYGNRVRPIDLHLPRGTDPGEIETLTVGQDEILVRVRPYGGEERCRVIRLMEADMFTWFVRCMA